MHRDFEEFDADGLATNGLHIELNGWLLSRVLGTHSTVVARVSRGVGLCCWDMHRGLPVGVIGTGISHWHFPFFDIMLADECTRLRGMLIVDAFAYGVYLDDLDAHFDQGRSVDGGSSS